MRRIAVALVVAGAWALAPISTYADDGLTSLVNSLYPSRTVSVELHQLAHQRAVEIATDFSHAGQIPGTGEVIGWNQGVADPVARIVTQWAESPVHHNLLSDFSFRELGCGSHTVGNIVYFACLLGFGDSPPPPRPVPTPPAEQPAPSLPPGPALLPNTATEP